MTFSNAHLQVLPTVPLASLYEGRWPERRDGNGSCGRTPLSQKDGPEPKQNAMKRDAPRAGTRNDATNLLHIVALLNYFVTLEVSTGCSKRLANRLTEVVVLEAHLPVARCLRIPVGNGLEQAVKRARLCHLGRERDTEWTEHR